MSPEAATHQVGSGCLLVRTDEGEGFSFFHQTVMEWLVADAAARQLRAGNQAGGLLSNRELSSLMADFLIGLTGCEPVLSWAQAVLASAEASEQARNNAQRLIDRCGTPNRRRLDGR